VAAAEILHMEAAELVIKDGMVVIIKIVMSQ
jgi:hypothetical protein